MSIPVELADLARALEDFGDGYLLTTGARGVKAITVSAAVADGFVLTPSSAVLHRPAAHADGEAGSSACGHDCEPV